MNQSIQQYQTTDQPPKQKAFNIVPAEDETTSLIIGARRAALFDPQLKDGAKVLFCLLLDLAVSRASSYGFGAALISVTKLTEALNRCPRAIYSWKKQLIAKRYVWITKVPMPNFWPVDVYHITALTEPGEMSQMPTRDGFWGNGARRQLPEKIGMGAREPGQKALGLRGTKVHRKEFDPDSSNLPENATESGTKGTCPPHESAAASGTKVQRGAAQNDTGEPHEMTPGSRTKVQRPAAQKGTGQRHKGDHIRQSKVLVLSVLNSDHNVIRANALAKGSGEPEFFAYVAKVMAKHSPKFAEEELTGSGGWWRTKCRQDKAKAIRVLDEIARMIKERETFSKNPGATAVDLWGRFA